MGFAKELKEDAGLKRSVVLVDVCQYVCILVYDDERLGLGLGSTGIPHMDTHGLVDDLSQFETNRHAT